MDVPTPVHKHPRLLQSGGAALAASADVHHTRALLGRRNGRSHPLWHRSPCASAQAGPQQPSLEASASPPQSARRCWRCSIHLDPSPQLRDCCSWPWRRCESSHCSQCTGSFSHSCATAGSCCAAYPTLFELRICASVATGPSALASWHYASRCLLATNRDKPLTALAARVHCHTSATSGAQQATRQRQPHLRAQPRTGLARHRRSQPGELFDAPASPAVRRNGLPPHLGQQPPPGRSGHRRHK